MSMYQVAVKRPVAITMVVFGVVVFGVIAYKQLPLNLMPRMNYPSLTIRTEYPGSSPEEVELELSRPIEEILGTVGNLMRLTSRSRPGLSEVIIEFDWRAKMEIAMQEVREKLDLIKLPETALRPILLRYDPNLDPMMRLGLWGTQVDLFRLRTYAEDVLRPALETLPGVAAVKIRGGLEKEVEIGLDERKISSLGLTIKRVTQRLKEENINLAGGRLQEGATHYWVRTLNEFAKLDEIGELLIEERDGKPIRLGDIAKIKFHPKEQEVVTRFKGGLCIELSVFREADANIVEVAKRVRERIQGTAVQLAWLQTYQEERAARREKRQERRTRKHEVKKDAPTAQKGKKKGGQRLSRKGMQQSAEQRMLKAMTNFLVYHLPPEMNLDVLQDQSIFIKQAIDEVLDSAVMGGIISIIVLLFFMQNLWSTFIVGLSIPLSVVATYGGLYLCGVSLNIMSLGGLALGIGMLVDNSIVVLESIFRFQEEGVAADIAAVQGTEEVGSAVIASTLTTVAVFFPIIFVQGMAGEMLRDMALTVVISLVSSLIVSLFFIPMLAALRVPSIADLSSQPQAASEGPTSAGAASKGTSSLFSWQAWSRLKESLAWAGERWQSGGLWKVLFLIFGLPGLLYLLVSFVFQTLLELVFGIWTVTAKLMLLLIGLFYMVARLLTKILWTPLAFLIDGFLNALYWLYPRSLQVCLRLSGTVLLLVVGLSIVSYFLGGRLEREFMPKVHQGEFHLEIALPVGTPLLQTAARLRSFEDGLNAMPNVLDVAAAIGVEKTEIQNAEKGEHSGTLTVRLKPTKEIERQERRVLEEIRVLLQQQPGVRMKVVYPSLFSMRTPIEIEIKGEQHTKLREISREALSLLQEVPSLRDVRSSAIAGLPEIQIHYDRERLFRYGLSVQDVAQSIRDKVYGAVATRFRERDKRLDVLVRIRRDQLTSLQALLDLNIHSAQGIPIPLRQVARLKVDEGPSEILRVSNQRAVVISAEIEGVALGQLTTSIEAELAKLNLPAGYAAGLSGQSEEMERSLRGLLYALLLSIFLVYLVMASQFESFLSPFIILFSIPLALIGVIVALWWLSLPLSVMCFIGMIILAGIVVNNAIVLVDAIGRLTDRGVALDAAIQRAGEIRLRPILMTTLTTVLGLLPLALGLGEGAELRRPMAITIMAGLTFSTLLTLVVIPIIYRMIFARLRPELLQPHAATDASSIQLY